MADETIVTDLQKRISSLEKELAGHASMHASIAKREHELTGRLRELRGDLHNHLHPVPDDQGKSTS